MGRRRSLVVEEVLPLIVRLFWRHGYDGLTLDQVAQELGVTKPTLFRTLGIKKRSSRRRSKPIIWNSSSLAKTVWKPPLI